jgi:hypothetical protein
MLTNIRSCLYQKPDWNCCATARVMSPRACARTLCASSSACGATNSPARKVTSASGMPTRTNAQPTCSSDAPAVRITVYSELETSWASANSVPISVATGKSS